jgi:hypothetical protein
MDAENARLLDRLTKQQEINQSLRVENAKLKAEKDESEKNWGDLSEKFEGDRDCWRWAEVEMWIEKLNEQIEKLNAELKMDRGTRKAVIEALGGNEADCFQPYPDDIKLRDITGTIESLKANLVKKDAEHKAEVDKLKRNQSDTEREMKYMYGYIMNCGNGWNEFAEHLSHGITGKDITINWSWLEEDFNLFSVVYYEPDPITQEPIETKTTLIRAKNEIDDFDAGPTPEELEAHRKFFSDEVLESTIKSIEYIKKVYDFPAEVYMSDTARGLKHSPGKPQKKRVIVVWYENGVMVEKMLMRKRGYCHSHKTEVQHYAPAPRGGVEPTENGWKCCDKAGDMVFIENGEFVNGHYLADFQ